MNRKYIVLESLGSVGAIAFDKVFTDMIEAKEARDTRVEECAAKYALANNEEMMEAARSTARSFVKVYELVAVDL